MSSISSKQFEVVPADISETGSRAARRLIFHADVLKVAKMCAGDAIALTLSGTDDHGRPTTGNVFAVGVAWPSLEISQDSILVSSSLLMTARLVQGAKARIFPLSGAAAVQAKLGLPSLRHAREACTVTLRELSEGIISSNSVRNSNDKGKQKDWLTLLLREALVDLKYITSAQIVEVSYEGLSRRFSVASVSPQAVVDVRSVSDLAGSLEAVSLGPSSQLWIIGWDTSISILVNEAHQALADHKPEATASPNTQSLDSYASVGGLDKQISQIRDLLEIPLTRPELFRHFGLKPPRGILLHGPPGTGKTHLARAIASSTNSSVLIVNGPELSSAYHGETESKLRDVFREAREKSPCIVVLDEVDALVPRREDSPGGEVEKRVVATLLTILDGMEDENAGGRVVVVGTTNRPNAIDPALRRPGRFDREIEIGIPDAEARFAILDVLLSRTPNTISQPDLRSLASRAHGYVGADLSAVVREAGTLAIKRWLAAHPTPPPAPPAEPPASAPDLTLTLPDLLASLPAVRPSAMRSLFVDTPPLRYADIGGQAAVIQKLREAVEWPLLHPAAFARLGARPPKGVLLYGPPGCSKTILVRACACESGVNFVAVKGPELLNKFVGESERAVREIFRKARAAAPSIIFFDEIDALATSRASAGAESGAGAGTGAHEGVLTSLLNEMDGVQELLGVTVVAATNRPDVIDAALMRPGRLDRLLYVGPPDEASRAAILRIRMRKMSVGADVDVGAIAQLADGCSGAEIAGLCQEAALLTMKDDMGAEQIPHAAFVAAAKAVKRQITPAMIRSFERWRDGEGAEVGGV